MKYTLSNLGTCLVEIRTELSVVGAAITKHVHVLHPFGELSDVSAVFDVVVRLALQILLSSRKALGIVVEASE